MAIAAAVALQPLDALDTANIYELIVERHLSAATVVTSNREPIEWRGLMADPLLAQSAIDRRQFAAHELVLEGDSYRPRQKPAIAKADQPLDPGLTSRDHHVADVDDLESRSHVTGAEVVPSSWRTTIAHLRTSVDAVAARVRSHEERIRRLEHRRAARSA